MPADRVRLGDNFWPLARANDGTILYKQEPLPFFPPQIGTEEVTEAQFPPSARQPYTVSDVSGGQGQAWVPFSGPNRRYDRTGDVPGEGVDASLSPEAPILLAGKPTEFPLAGASAAADFANWLWPINDKVYFPMGGNFHSFDGTTVARVGTLAFPNNSFGGAGRVFRFRGSQPVDYWYSVFTTGNQAQYSTDSGVTWAALTPTTIRDAVEIDGEVVVAMVSPRTGKVTQIAAFDDGGTTPTLYGVIDPIGNPNIDITRLIVLGGRILVQKDGEGLYVLSPSRRTLQRQIAPELVGTTFQAAAVQVWRDHYLALSNRGLYVITPDFRCVAVGPQINEARRSGATVLGNEPSSGIIFGAAGDAYNLYALRFNLITGVRWLVKARVEITPGGDIARIFWHDFLKLPPRQHGTLQTVSLGVVTYLLTSRADSSGGALLISLRLPANGADPRNDPNYRYVPAGTFYPSRLHARFPNITKTSFGITPLCAPLQTAVDGTAATTAQAVRVRSKLDTTPLTNSPPWGYDESGDQVSGSGTRVPIQLRGRGLDIGIRLTTTDPTTSPQLQSVTVDYEVEPEPLWRHVMTLNLGEGGITASGDTSAGDPQTPGAALLTLRALASSGPLTMINPWGGAHTVTIPTDGILLRAGGPREESSSQEVPLLVDVVAIEQETYAVNTYGRLKLVGGSYGDLTAAGVAYGALGNL